MDTGCAVVQSHDGFYDCKTETSAPQISSAGTVDPVETVKNSLQMLRGNRRSLVHHFQTDAIIQCLHDYAYLSAWRAMTNCIGQQIGDGALNQPLVCSDQSFSLNFDRDPTLLSNHV